MEKAWNLALWSVLVCRIAIITDNSKGGGRHRSHPKAERTEQMKIEKNDMVMVYDGGGTVPHCQYTGRFGDLTAYWQEIVSDAVYLFRLGESEECDWLVLFGQPWSPYSPDGIR